ncbi:hypothetical protein Pryu01_00985 [Paraliobacillus ryukyuensis]|uniref:Uncharacterized protein n=1 Tax=Paraliobacillus ryukyuensis TaxID=200904 RepID=A0A366EDQ0_9BACI|nr:hypothetical protein [Paraliobacillus ryukyuensis]RBP00443.1 hypothetical protein DES48_102205 [Paraliobacillus ryukyuensis]
MRKGLVALFLILIIGIGSFGWLQHKSMDGIEVKEHSTLTVDS